MVHPARGQVVLDGQDVTRVPAARLVGRGVVLVQGGQGVFPDITVGENLDVQALTIWRDKRTLTERRNLVFSTFPGCASACSRRPGRCLAVISSSWPLPRR